MSSSRYYHPHIERMGYIFPLPLPYSSRVSLFHIKRRAYRKIRRSYKIQHITPILLLRTLYKMYHQRAKSVTSDLPTYLRRTEPKPPTPSLKRRAESAQPQAGPPKKRAKTSPRVEGPSEDEDLYARRARLQNTKDQAVSTISIDVMKACY